MAKTAKSTIDIDTEPSALDTPSDISGNVTSTIGGPANG
jgi:hypothetical protein